MRTTDDARIFCEENDIRLEEYPLPLNGSVSYEEGEETGIILDSADMTEARRKTLMAHELGHCMTGAFYHPYSPLETRSRCEYRANRWAIEQFLPRKELDGAFRAGMVEVWELAEYFDMTEDFIRLACRYYYGKN